MQSGAPWAGSFGVDPRWKYKYLSHLEIHASRWGKILYLECCWSLLCRWDREQPGTRTCLDWDQDSTCSTYRVCTKHPIDDTQNTPNPFLVPAMKFLCKWKLTSYGSAALNTSPWNVYRAELDGTMQVNSCGTAQNPYNNADFLHLPNSCNGARAMSVCRES